MRARFGLCTTAVLMLLAVSPAAHAAPTPVKQCSLLTQPAAVALFGAPLDPAKDAGVACIFSGPGADDKKGVIVSVITSASMNGMNLTSMYNQMLEKKPGDIVEPVSGLGEQARMITTDGGTSISLQVLYHGNIFGIMASNSPNHNIKAALKDTAKQMLSRF